MVASVLTVASHGDPLHPSNNLSHLQNVFIHECFHLFSKNQPETRHRLYQLVHYEFSTTRSSCPTSRGAQRPRLLFVI